MLVVGRVKKRVMDLFEVLFLASSEVKHSAVLRRTVPLVSV
jgi:hypothetical protein